jgi:arylsulfatase A-like enzyme
LGDVLSNKATAFISRAAALGQPFFVNISTYAPHVADVNEWAQAAPRHTSLFSGIQAPRTPNWDEADISDKPAWLRNSEPNRLGSSEITELDNWYRRRVQAMQSVDDMILSIVNTLNTTGKFNNTYIFITSDNGYHSGNHRLHQGKESPYEEDVRVPMWVIGPGVPAGQTRDHLAINTDLAPTFAALGGVTPPANVDGHSLVSLLGSNPPSISNWRSAVLLEHGVTGPLGPIVMEQVADPQLLEPEENWWSSGLRAPQNEVAAPSGTYSGVRTDNYKYIEYATERELYDLRSDPYELQNTYSSATPSLRSYLSALVAALHTCSGANCWVTNQPTAVTLYAIEGFSGGPDLTQVAGGVGALGIVVLGAVGLIATKRRSH